MPSIVIQSKAKDLGSIKWVFPRFFTTFHSALNDTKCIFG